MDGPSAYRSVCTVNSEMHGEGGSEVRLPHMPMVPNGQIWYNAQAFPPRPGRNGGSYEMAVLRYPNVGHRGCLSLETSCHGFRNRTMLWDGFASRQCTVSTSPSFCRASSLCLGPALCSGAGLHLCLPPSLFPFLRPSLFPSCVLACFPSCLLACFPSCVLACRGDSNPGCERHLA
jgi:hypothetical protein